MVTKIEVVGIGDGATSQVEVRERHVDSESIASLGEQAVGDIIEEGQTAKEKDRSIEELVGILGGEIDGSALTYDEAQRLLDSMYGGSVAENLDKFQGLNSDIAQQLIDSGYGYSVAKNIDKFQGLDHSIIAQQLIDNGGIVALVGNLDKFQGLDHSQIAQQLIDSGYGYSVAKNIDKFQGLDHSIIAQQLIDNGGIMALVGNLDKFQGLDHSIIAQQIIDSGYGGSVAENLDKFQGLNSDIAQQLIDSGYGYSVAKNIDKFQGLDHSIIAQQLIDNGGIVALVGNLDKFQGLDNESIRMMLAESGDERLVLDNLDKFPGYQPDARKYVDNAYTHMTGFSRRAIGELIKRRMDAGVEYNIHDASFWLQDFVIPNEWYDIEAIKSSPEGVGSIDDFREKLIDGEVEGQFILQLLDANQDLRARLTYGNAPKLTDRDKLSIVFELDSSIKKDFNIQLGKNRARLTEDYYEELLSNPDINRAWEEFRGNGGDSKKKFFREYFSEHEDLLSELEGRAVEMQARIESEALESALASDDAMKDAIESRTKKGGEEWFYHPECKLLYQAACSEISSDDRRQLYKKDDFSIHDLFGRAHSMVDGFYEESFGRSKDELSHKMTKEELVAQLNKVYEYLVARQYDNGDFLDKVEIKEDWQAQLRDAYKTIIAGSKGSLSDTVVELKKMSRGRERYVRDAQSWLNKHELANSVALRRVWGDRVMALSEGVEDSVPSIGAWQRNNAFRLELDRRESSGELQLWGLDREYIDTRADDVAELIRVMSANDTVEVLAKLKKWREGRDWQDKKLPPSVMKIDNRYSLDIFDKDDPRGYTIGEDTACCMTNNGESESCIKAGYKKDNAGFMGLYEPSGDLLAQSFWYIHPENPDTVVLDNIEANQGRDMSRIVELYQQGLKQYIDEHPELGIRRVTVGTGHTDVSLEELKGVVPIPPLTDQIYTDAHNQRLLLDTQAEELQSSAAAA